MSLYDVLVALSPPSRVHIWTQLAAVAAFVLGVGVLVAGYREEDQ